MAVAALPEGWPVISIAQANAAIAASDSPLKLADGVVDGVEMKVYPDAPPTIRAIFQLAEPQFGARDYLVYEDERVTYSAFARAVEHFAKALQDTYGIQKGDRVAVVMRNYPQWPVPFFAALSIGAIATPMNSWWTGDELEYGLKDSGAKVAVIDPQIMDRIRDSLPNLPDLKSIIIARGGESDSDPRVTTMDSIVGPTSSWAGLAQISLPDVDLGPDDDATIMYTSGTTGRPKGALATHRAIIANMLNSLSCQMRMLLRRGETPPEPDPNEQNATLLAIPFFHATGAFAILIPSMLQGAKIVAQYKWDAGKALPIIEKEGITNVGGVPA
ncbi:MAG: class I adenylate-forming enzyme family protein, partial [Pseudomonadota bacterium]